MHYYFSYSEVFKALDNVLQYRNLNVSSTYILSSGPIRRPIIRVGRSEGRRYCERSLLSRRTTERTYPQYLRADLICCSPDRDGWLKCRWTHRLRLGRSLQGIPAKGHLNGARIGRATRPSPSQSAKCSQEASRDTEIKSEFHTARQKQANSFTNSNPAAPMCRYVNVTRLESLKSVRCDAELFKSPSPVNRGRSSTPVIGLRYDARVIFCHAYSFLHFCLELFKALGANLKGFSFSRSANDGTLYSTLQFSVQSSSSV